MNPCSWVVVPNIWLYTAVCFITGMLWPVTFCVGPDDDNGTDLVLLWWVSHLSMAMQLRTDILCRQSQEGTVPPLYRTQYVVMPANHCFYVCIYCSYSYRYFLM